MPPCKPRFVSTISSRATRIRGAGWVVAVHNDYRKDGKPHTFWLFTKDGFCVKGEAETDAGALAVVEGEIARVTLNLRVTP